MPSGGHRRPESISNPKDLFDWIDGIREDVDAIDPILEEHLELIESIEGDVTTHVANVSNPHSVTKTQVGLGNAENTADLAKPISTAMQTALDTKASAATAPIV